MATGNIISKVNTSGAYHRLASSFYGVCSTAANIAQKVATIPITTAGVDEQTFTDSMLVTGITI